MSYIFKGDANSVAIGDSNTQEVIPLNRKGATSNVYIVRIDGNAGPYGSGNRIPDFKPSWGTGENDRIK